MVALILWTVVGLAQAPCPSEAAALFEEARTRAMEFDLTGAAGSLEMAAARGCAEAEVAALYVRGLVAARAAFLEGGSSESLAAVRQAIAALERRAPSTAAGRAGAGVGTAGIARLLLHAAAAAAQSERDEMRLYLESAVQLESLHRAAGETGAPIVSAAETAGDLWLQVHRYEEARRAYQDAAARVGTNLRILAGLARSARQLGDASAACSAYRTLTDTWGGRPGLPLEIAEARAYLGACPQ